MEEEAEEEKGEEEGVVLAAKWVERTAAVEVEEATYTDEGGIE